MTQALHIFKKDFRYLRLETALLCVLALAIAYSGVKLNAPTEIEILYMVVASFAITRAVHAEPIPGDRQFWITRPYRWYSLLLAKLLFILVNVNLPLLLARIVVLKARDFPIGPSLPGLFWSQLLMILAIALPVAALAAVTSGTVPFIMVVFCLFAAVFGRQFVHPMSRANASMLTIDWIWGALIVAVLLAIAVPILLVQYKTRSTTFSWIYGAALLIIGITANAYLPWQAAYALETRLPAHQVNTSTYNVEFAPEFKRRGYSQYVVDIPMLVTGIPDSVQVQGDALSLSLETPSGRIWKTRPIDLPAVESSPSKSSRGLVSNALVPIDQTFEKEAGNQSLTLRGSVYLTIFGNTRSKTIPIQAKPAPALDSMHCAQSWWPYIPSSRQYRRQLVCRAPFQWPAALVSANFPETDERPMLTFPSYSPFPAGLDFDLTDIHTVDAPASADQVTIVVKDRLETIRRDFEVHGLHLADIKGPVPMK